MLVEGVIQNSNWKIQAAAALYLRVDWSILPGKLALLVYGPAPLWCGQECLGIPRVVYGPGWEIKFFFLWERENQIKLRWNNWFDVSLCSLQIIFRWIHGALIASMWLVLQYFTLGERFQLYLSWLWCFMHMAVICLVGQHICNSIVHKINTAQCKARICLPQCSIKMMAPKIKYVIGYAIRSLISIRSCAIKT